VLGFVVKNQHLMKIWVAARVELKLDANLHLYPLEEVLKSVCSLLSRWLGLLCINSDGKIQIRHM
jgi:hypothetical protein